MNNMLQRTFTITSIAPVYSVYLNACSNEQFHDVNKLHHSNNCSELLYPPTDSLSRLNFILYKKVLFFSESQHFICKGEYCENLLHCIYLDLI